MSKVCLNSADSNVSALVEASKSNFTGFSDNQILAVGSLYFEKYNKLPDASELLDFSKQSNEPYMDVILSNFSLKYPANIVRYDLESYIPGHRGIIFQDRNKFPSSIG